VLGTLAAHAAELHSLGARWLTLFGSFSRDAANADSAVDLLIDLDRHTFDRYMDLKIRLEDMLGRRVVLGPVESLKPRIRDRVLREAIRVVPKPDHR
jgi:predicted nucleotidyltransferase